MKSTSVELTREERIARIIVIAGVMTLLIIVTVVYYTRKISTQLFRIGADNVEETYREVGQLFNEIAESRWRDLEFLHEYMYDTAVSYDDRTAIIERYREEIGFTYYCLIDDEANYTSVRGGSGNFAFGSRRMATLTGSTHSLLDATMPDGENIVLFVCRSSHPIIYNDHSYTAMALAYNEHDLGEVLKVTSYDGSSYPYILNSNGRAMITSDLTTTESKVANLLDYLRDEATFEGTTADAVIEQFKEQETITCVVHDDQGDFYLSFQPLGIQDYMLASFTPVSAVDSSIDLLRNNTSQMITIVVGLIFLLVLYGLVILYMRNIRRKNAQLESKDAQIESKDAQIEVKNTELRIRNAQLEEALEAAQMANQAKTTFLANVSHDIRTPMNAVIGFATLAQREIDDKEKVANYLRKIQDSSHHLLNLINDVLDYTKIEAGKVSLRTEHMEVATIIGRVDSMLRPQMIAKEQTFTVTYDCKTKCIVEMDELRLTQILVNILSNAYKYTPKGGHISLHVREEVKNHVARYWFVIRDDGVGMSEEYLQALYEPFTREVKSTTNKVQGTGLGMAITKNLVDLMGGIIEVQSQKGVGTTFTVTLGFKVVDMLEEDKVDDDAEAESISLEGLHILIAEDNELNAEIIAELLQMEGCDVKVTENGRLCAEEFQAQPQGTYDLILMDVQMPEMNGYEATQAIRHSDHPGCREIPIIAMTANAFAEDKRNALEAGMNAHVAKPVDMKILKKTIRQVLK